MKKLIGIFLSIAMLLGLSATALASTPPDTPPISPTGIVYPQETVSSATGFLEVLTFPAPATVETAFVIGSRTPEPPLAQ